MEGISVYVEVDSNQAQIYQSETVSKLKRTKRTKGYIESVGGKPSSVHVRGMRHQNNGQILISSLTNPCLMYNVASPGVDCEASLFIDGER